ncbi:MAG: hypothetical protein AB7O84_19030 [Planctomycetota bacterium]
MLRRSLILFLAFVLLGLGLTAGYAMLGLRGPDDVLAEAQGLLQSGDASAAIKLLDRCEPGAGMRDNPELLRGLWRLRLRAHIQVNNARRALDDIDNLLRSGDSDPGLLMNRIFYLGRTGDGERARQHALEFVAAQPQLARAQELAGEACKVAYTDELAELSKQLRSDLGYERERAGIAAFLEYLYRPAGDPLVPTAQQELQQLYETEPRFQQAWPRLRDRIRALRERIQEALGYFQRSLELARTDPSARQQFLAAAFGGVAFALQQADRDDDIVAQSEIYLTNYDHRFTSWAAIAAVDAHYRDGQYQAAVELADRFLPDGSFAARFAANKLDGQVRDLLVTKALALYRLGRATDLARLGAEAHRMAQQGLAVPGVPQLSVGLSGVLNQSDRNLEPQLAGITSQFLSAPAPQEGEDPLDLLMPLRLELARGRDLPQQQQLQTVNAWVQARPGNLLPLRERARMQLRFGQAAAAMSTAEAILKAAPTDEEGLRLLADAADAAYRGASQDGDSLLVQCLQRGSQRPELVPNPVCMLLCAEAALRQGRPGIARACARAGSDTYPWSRWPRLLEARAELVAGNTEAALDLLDRAIAADPEDVEAIGLWFQTRVRLEQPTDAHLADVVRTHTDDRAVLTALLRQALAQGSPAAAAFARRAQDMPDASPELLALAAQALARADQAIRALNVLGRSRAAAAESPSVRASDAQTFAAIAAIAALGEHMDDAALADRAAAELQQCRLGGPEIARALLHAAASLEAGDRPRSGWLLASAALALDDAIEVRDADSFLLAARLLLRLGDLDGARARFTAALSFPGGEAAAEPLARLALLTGDQDRLQAAMALVKVPDDPALALLAGRDDAAALAQQRMRKDASDLQAALAFALAHAVDPGAIGAGLRELDPALRRAALELAALLPEKAFAKELLPRAEALVAGAPTSRAAQLLLARAFADGGMPRRAAELHTALFEAGCRELPLYGEAVRAELADGNYPMPRSLRAELRLLATQEPARVPPRLLAYTGIDVAAEAARAGQGAVAVKVLAQLWLHLPEASGATTESAQQLLAQGERGPALERLHILRTRGSPAERERATIVLFRLGVDQGAVLGPLVTDNLRSMALADLQTDAPIDPPLRFLLADPRRVQQLPPARERELLQRAVRGACTGEAGVDLGRAALAHLQSTRGRAAALAMVEATLTAHAAAPWLWIERARLLTALREDRRGLEDARRMLRYVDDPQLVLEFTVLAAEQRALVPADHDRLQEQPPAVLQTPLGTYARGLCALRRGDGDRAETLLAAAPARPDGFHLYARALANLMRRAPDARARARELFEQLAQRYPSSSPAQNAGSFALQLSPN